MSLYVSLSPCLNRNHNTHISCEILAHNTEPDPHFRAVDDSQLYRGPGRPSPNYYDYNTRPGWQSSRYNTGTLTYTLPCLGLAKIEIYQIRNRQIIGRIDTYMARCFCTIGFAMTEVISSDDHAKTTWKFQTYLPIKYTR